MSPSPTPSPPRLFSAEAILAHTLIATPVVGSILAATNQRRLGHRAASRQAIFFFAVPSALILAAEVIASEHLSPYVRLGGFAWTIFVARRLFLEHQVLFAKHVAAGGQPARWYLVTLLVLGVVLLGMTAVFASEFL